MLCIAFVLGLVCLVALGAQAVIALPPYDALKFLGLLLLGSFPGQWVLALVLFYLVMPLARPRPGHMYSQRAIAGMIANEKRRQAALTAQTQALIAYEAARRTSATPAARQGAGNRPPLGRC